MFLHVIRVSTWLSSCSVRRGGLVCVESSGLGGFWRNQDGVG